MRTIPVRQQMIPRSNRNRPGFSLNSSGVLDILVHETGNTNPGADAEMHADFVYSGGGKGNVSFHFTVDEKEAWQMLPLNEGGYHAGDGCNNRATDWGCFASVAIETCVHDDNRYKEKIRDNLIILCAMIINGHPSINYGGVDHKRFSAEHIHTHQQASDDNKYCPTYMLRDGYVPKIRPLVEKELASGPAAPSVKIPFVFRYELPIRVAPGFNGKIVKFLPEGTTGTLISGPKNVDGIDWYDVDVVGFGTGWVPASILRTLNTGNAALAASLIDTLKGITE